MAPLFDPPRHHKPSFRPERRPGLVFVPLLRDGRRGVEESLCSFCVPRSPDTVAAREAKEPQADLRASLEEIPLLAVES